MIFCQKISEDSSFYIFLHISFYILLHISFYTFVTSHSTFFVTSHSTFFVTSHPTFFVTSYPTFFVTYHPKFFVTSHPTCFVISHPTFFVTSHPTFFCHISRLGYDSRSLVNGGWGESGRLTLVIRQWWQLGLCEMLQLFVIRFNYLKNFNATRTFWNLYNMQFVC